MNLILKVMDFSILCNFVVKETGFLLFFFWYAKNELFCNGGHTLLTLSRFTFLWIRDFPNTGHKQSRDQRSTEASLALGWD